MSLVSASWSYTLSGPFLPGTAAVQISSKSPTIWLRAEARPHWIRFVATALSEIAVGASGGGANPHRRPFPTTPPGTYAHRFAKRSAGGVPRRAGRASLRVVSRCVRPPPAIVAFALAAQDRPYGAATWMPRPRARPLASGLVRSQRAKCLGKIGVRSLWSYLRRRKYDPRTNRRPTPQERRARVFSHQFQHRREHVPGIPAMLQAFGRLAADLLVLVLGAFELFLGGLRPARRRTSGRSSNLRPRLSNGPGADFRSLAGSWFGSLTVVPFTFSPNARAFRPTCAL